MPEAQEIGPYSLKELRQGRGGRQAEKKAEQGGEA